MLFLWVDIQIKYGIQLTCSHRAPLLFIIAAEVLALAIQQIPQIEGIEVPGADGERHKFSAFVDDSTVFMSQAKQLPIVMTTVENFGKLSGLHVQPAKSKIIFLNKSIKLQSLYGIPVLQDGDTVRYLGYAVGTGELTGVNWAARIRNVQRRLATATQLATSVENRVTILNVIMLPSVLFTAAVFEMPAWVEKQLKNMQKQFLWHHSTSTDSSRNKVNTGLLYTPKKAGGVGLASVVIATTTQRVKHAMQWLIQSKDIYFAAWKAWAFRGAEKEWGSHVSPRQEPKKTPTGQTPGAALQVLLGSWLKPHEAKVEDREKQYRQVQVELQEDSVSWMENGEWRVELSRELPQPIRKLTEEEERFWPVYYWDDNPWILDSQGNTLTAKKYDKIERCTIEALKIQREGENKYSMIIPTRGGKEHRPDKLRRWAITVLLSTPGMEIGETMRTKRELRLRHPVKMLKGFEWELISAGLAQGTRKVDDPEHKSVIMMQQMKDGIHWELGKVSEGGCEWGKAVQKLKSREEGLIVFYAHPLLHGFPWKVEDSIANKHVHLALKNQAFRRYKGKDARLEGLVAVLTQTANKRQWQEQALQQTPEQIWAHRNELTEYQVWVVYRMVLKQLNLFHEGKKEDNSCKKLECCRGKKETMEHIFWECPCAQVCWQKLICHWSGERWKLESLQGFMSMCANRRPPSLTVTVKERLQRDHPDDEDKFQEEWKRIWRIMCSICITMLWTRRNEVVFERKQETQESSVQMYWSTATRQLRALAKRERRQPETRLQGTRLMICVALLEEQPREPSPTVTSPVQPLDHKAPALITRLRTYQISCNQ